MPAKYVRLQSGRVAVIKSVRLPNGNLLIPKRMTDWSTADWVEVEPGTPDYKRWSTVAVDEPDPRETAEYKEWKAK